MLFTWPGPLYVRQPKAMCDGRIPENVKENTPPFSYQSPMHEHSIAFFMHSVSQRDRERAEEMCFISEKRYLQIERDTFKSERDVLKTVGVISEISQYPGIFTILSLAYVLAIQVYFKTLSPVFTVLAIQCVKTLSPAFTVFAVQCVFLLVFVAKCPKTVHLLGILFTVLLGIVHPLPETLQKFPFPFTSSSRGSSMVDEVLG
ncbi:hypothetical protein TNCV_627271 [Trichonephila clavipes]|nr:hypothetical protein TNCV_627271 [Trichonephila clavipes]